jgi:riboflavin synthase
MFTGIITDIGTIISLTRTQDMVCVVRTRYDLATIQLGASIACSGVCLTVTEKGEGTVSFNVSAETLSRTTLGEWQVGTAINLERALKMGDELGGHLVSGHIDGVARVQEISMVGDAHRLVVEVPAPLARYIAEKGSVTLDGVSLTVNGVEDRHFWVTLIPHTWQHTTFSQLKPGMGLNLEIDMLARYVERMLYKESTH